MSDIWFNTLFQLRLYEAQGATFQDLFNKVMTAYYGDNFQTVRPWGAWGDRGNDGFLKKEQRYFQLFAPEPTTSIRDIIKNVIKKVKNDFSKLIDNYRGLKKYSFLMNDYFKGIPEFIHRELQEISRKHKIETDSLGAHWLLNKFSELDLSKKQNILNSPPLEFTEDVAPALIKDTLDWIIKNAPPVPSPKLLDKDKKLNFEKKIKFNNLNSYFAKLLDTAYYEVDILERMLTEQPDLLQKAASILSITRFLYLIFN